MGDIFNKTLHLGEGLDLTLGRVLWFLLALVISWLVTRIIVRLLYNGLKRRGVDSGKAFSIKQIVKFGLYILFLIISLQILQLNLHGLLLGASALLIGVGIGLQQIFYDLFSGLLMLIERKVKVGDFVDMDGMVGRVDRIDMRTSVVRTLDNISVVVPNSKLISDNVINWSSNRGLARFSVEVGVAYGSDTKLVRQTLVDCAIAHDKVLNKPAPIVQFKSFGDSALQFKLLFWSRQFKEIELVKSDLHYAIDDAFRAARIEIAFPQIDVHMRHR